MNSPQPSCPACGAIKLEDHGVYEPHSFMISSGQSKANKDNTDANLRRIADRHGLTDMSNKGGKGVKAVTGNARGDFGKINVHGVEVPVDHNANCSRLPMSSPLKVETGARMPNRQPVTKAVPTNMVAHTKGGV